MANKVTVETSGTRDIQEAYVECRENIPPRAGAAAGMSKPDLHVEAQSSLQSSGESQSLSDLSYFATPAAAGGSGRGRAKARMSGLQSALTPILKYMNIGMKRLPVDPSKPGNNPHQTVPFFSFGHAAQPGSVNLHPNSDLGLSMMGIDAPVQWLDEEYFPEITLLDVTCDTTMQMNRTPACARQLVRNPEHDVDMNWKSKMSSTLTPKMDLSSALSPEKNMSPLNITQDISSVASLKPNEPSSEVTDQILSQSGGLQTSAQELSGTLPGNITHTLSSFHEQSDVKCDVGVKACLELTRDISMGSELENSRPSIDPNGENRAIAQMQATMTHDVNSSDISGLCAKSKNATFDMQPNAGSKNVTTDLNVDPMQTPVSSKENNVELVTEPAVAAEGTNPTLQLTKSMNSTFTTLQLSQCSATTTSNTTFQASCPQNQTLDLPVSNVSSSSVETETVSASNSSTEVAVMDQNCPTAKTSGLCGVQNTTFDRHSLHKSSEGAGLTTLSPQNNSNSKTPCKPNSTITMSETTLGERHQTTFDQASPPDVCHTATCPDPTAMDVPPPEQSNDDGTIKGVTTNTETSDTPQNTVEANPPAEEADGVAKCETQDQSPLGLPAADGLSDTPGRQSLDMHSNQAHTFNLDDTLDLRSDSLITSTPMPTAKMFEFTTEREQAKSLTAQKKLYGEAPGKPVDQATSEIPSNIVCNRKTFLTQPAVKSLMNPLKTAPHLLKYKPATLLPGRFEPLMSGLPMTRQRALAETVTTAAPDVPQEATGVSSSYNLRATTAGSKPPNLGLRRPQQSGIPSGIQRVASSLRPPSARNNPPASSNTVKTNGTSAPNGVAKTSQTKKHPLTRAEALPAKKKKMDSPSSGRTEATTSSSDAASKAKNLRQPANCQKALPAKPQKEVLSDGTVPASTTDTLESCDAASRTKMLKLPATSQRAVPAKTQSDGCANCITLEQQLKVKSEEIQRLKEELLRYRKGEEEC